MTGKTILHYKILGKLGEGGMGVVYKAKDLKLKRTVALKFLNPEFLHDKANKALLLQEAQAAASFSHPNICTVYEINEIKPEPVENEDEYVFIAMEYIEGKNLKEKIQSGPLQIDNALDIAIQIAEGLREIHDKGMVHRDIKSDNIRITDKGQAKIMDFGLVKSPRIKENISQEGSTGGTVAYMSPEHIRGKNVDSRTDIWSWGIVFYEILTGQLPFKTDKDSMAVIYSIFDEEPEPVSKFWPDIPYGYINILDQALAKNPEDRYQSMKDLLIDLKKLGHEMVKADHIKDKEQSSPEPETVHINQKKWRIIIPVAVISILIVIAIIKIVSSRLQTIPEVKVSVLTSYEGIESRPELSPDGNKVAFTWRRHHEDNWDIYIKLIGENDYHRITSDETREYGATWSEDGNSIAYVRQGGGQPGIYCRPILGGHENRLYGFRNSAFQGSDIWPEIDWSWDGQWIVFNDFDTIERKHCLFRLDVKTKEREQLTLPGSGCLGDMNPSYSPDGKYIAFERVISAGIGDLYIVEIKSRQVARLTFDGIKIYDMAWMPDNREIVFSSYRDGSTRLWRIPANGGKVEPLDVVGTSNGAGGISISRLGNRMAYTVVVHNHDIWQADLPGAQPGKIEPYKIVVSSKSEISGDFSPGGERIAFISSRTGFFEIWTCRRDGSDQICITDFGAASPRWSPDGKWIVFNASPRGNNDIMIVDESGEVLPRHLTDDIADDRRPAWSCDGQWIYFGSNRTGEYQIHKVNVNSGEIVQVTSNGGFFGYESPDGKWLYFRKSKKGYGPIYKLNLENSEESIAINEQIHKSRWIVAREGIYYIITDPNGDNILKLYRYLSEVSEQVGLIEQRMFLSDISDDGHSLLLWNLNTTTDIYLAENFK